MKKTFLILMTMMTCSEIPAQESELEKNVLIDLVQETFVNGALNKMNTADMKKGFHPDFAILIGAGQNLIRLSLPQWIKVVEEYKKNPEDLKSNARNLKSVIDVLEITGNTAVVKTQFYRAEELILTDYLSYLKFPHGWQAVAKISHEHIPNPLNLKL